MGSAALMMIGSSRPALGLVGLGLVLLLALPFSVQELESGLSLHLLVQMPLLVLAGYLIGLAFGRRWRRTLDAYNDHGIPGMLMVSLAMAFWMLPRSLDLVLASPAMELTKFVSLPLLIGLPLSLSWSRLPVIGRGFIAANLISMLAVLGWLHLASPMRLCNYYLLDQQRILGWALLLLAAAVLVVWASRTFVDRRGTDGRPFGWAAGAIIKGREVADV